ncbi:MAG TPA: NADH-quinone oxidoreductase subunit L [Acidimicrobiia bacterium]|nr:NADH-quinone oxidoreductase subunit L [Acidimicrobiia bacterium]
MFFLDHAWLVPLLPALSFVVILLFGKRFPQKGSDVGTVAVGASFVLACGTLFQWIRRVQGADHRHGVGAAIGALGRSVGRLGAEGSAAQVAPVVHHLTWFQNNGVRLTVGIQIDGLASIVMFVVTLVSLLVHVYSMEYMRGDRRYTHYYAALSLFTASMLLLVVADNTLQLLVGWELVGLCSFMLIGHWWEEKPNSDAALKAFLTTRTGDIGLLVGVVMTYWLVDRASGGHGSFNILAVNQAASSPVVGHTLVMWTALALLLAIIGKSGQFPLHTWLPDAMAGPTPVSALIHAATMVVAGVYMGARLYPVFWHGLSIGTPGHGGVNAMALIGGITVLIGAALAFVQDDIKKVLAYSTISQLGYMVMALGVGAWTAAVFHLFTHAFFKADLFLGAGSVSHSGSHHSFDMKKDMGGLKQYMPQTFWTFVIGSLALAGIFPLAGFWSKDEILVNAGHNGYQAFLIVGLVGAFMTAAYMTRAVYLTFFGEYRGSVEHELAEVLEAEERAEGDELIEHHLAEEQDDYLPGFGPHAESHGAHAAPHESNRLLTMPLFVLSFLAVFAGFINAPGVQKFEKWFQPRVAFVDVRTAKFSVILAVVSVLIALAGIGAGYAYYWLGAGPQQLSERNPLARSVKHFLVMKYYLDVLYTDIIVGTLKGAIADGVYWFNQHILDNVLNYAGKGAVGLGRFTYDYIDQRGVDAAVNGLATVTGESGGVVRRVQTGRLQFYALILVLAVGLFALALWIFS